MIVLNVFLGIAELIVLVVSTMYFMAHVGRNIYLKRIYYLLSFLIYGIVLVFGSAVFRNDNIIIVIWILLSMAIGHFLYHRDILHLFYYAGFTMSIMLIQTGVILGMNTFYLGNGFTAGYGFSNICLVVKILLELFVTLIWTFIVNRKNIKLETKKQALGIFILPLFSVIFLISMMEMAVLFTRLYGFGLIVMNIVILLGLNIYFLYLYSYITKSNALGKELQLFQQQKKLQYHYYEDIEKKYQTSRTLIHDMRNHLHAVERLYKSGEPERAKEYVSDIHQILNSLGQKYYTGNRMLNIILNDKIDQAKEALIATEVQIGDIDLSGIKDIDTTVIFSNILDNAIEASGKCGEHPFIHIKADNFNEFIIISVKNSYNKEIIIKDKNHMGIGLNNVKRTLEKYNGNLQKKEQGQEFELCIMIPRQEEENEENDIFNNNVSSGGINGL